MIKAMLDQQKPHRGVIQNWVIARRQSDKGLEFVVGRFGVAGYMLTSRVICYDGCEIETLNSRYTLGEPNLEYLLWRGKVDAMWDAAQPFESGEL